MVSVNKAGDEVTLHLVATEPWGKKGKHVMLLQAKLKNYVSFAADGQLARQYPTAPTRRVRIQIRTHYPLGEAEEGLVEIVREKWCPPENIVLEVALVGP